MTYNNSFVALAWGWVWHLANFVLPALVLATLLAPLVAGWRGWPVRRWWHAWCWLAAGGLLVLLMGLAMFGVDGKMMTYAALVLTVGSVACWLQLRQPRTPASPPRRPARR